MSVDFAFRSPDGDLIPLDGRLAPAVPPTAGAFLLGVIAHGELMLITTTHGDLDESVLIKRVGSVENDNEATSWVEYYIGDELVHRSAHVTLKQGIGVEAVLGSFA